MFVTDKLLSKGAELTDITGCLFGRSFLPKRRGLTRRQEEREQGKRRKWEGRPEGRAQSLLSMKRLLCPEKKKHKKSFPQGQKCYPACSMVLPVFIYPSATRQNQFQNYFSTSVVSFVGLTHLETDDKNRHLIADRICCALRVHSLEGGLSPSHKSHLEPAQCTSAAGRGDCLLVCMSENERGSFSCDLASCFCGVKSPALVRDALRLQVATTEL